MSSMNVDENIVQAREKVREFWSKHGPTYDDGHGHGIHSPDERAKWSALFAEHIPEKSTVVDVGAGTGYCTLILAEQGHQVTALDWSDGMLSEARAKASAAGIEFAVQISDIENTPFGDASFDVLTARHVLWTLLHPNEAITEWARILKPGGRAIVDIGLGEHGKHYDDDVEGHLPMRSVASAQDVADLFTRNGFSSASAEIDSNPPHGNRQHIVIVAQR